MIAVRLFLEGGRFAYEGDEAAVEMVLPEIKAHRADLLAVLAQPPSLDAILVEACQGVPGIDSATFRALLSPVDVEDITNGVSRQLVYARENDFIPWSWVVDETRAPECVSAWDDPEQFAHTVQVNYRRNHWAHQPRRVEVWSEKGTVRGTLAPVLTKYGVTFRVMHGYSSATVVNQVAEETGDLENPSLALYVGDWGPSGLHMSEVDLPQRLKRYGTGVEIERVALTSHHVETLGLPSFEAITKRKDPRYQWYARRYGRFCWELDALNARDGGEADP